MSGIALLHPSRSYTHAQVSDSDLRDAIVAHDIYDLPALDLSAYGGLIVSSGCDQEFLLLHRDRVRAFLDAGKVLAFSGHLFRPWLPGAGMFHPKTIRSYHDYVVSLVADHPVFEGVRAEDLTFRKGVAGFFARGHHEPPAGAEIIAMLPGGEPIVYVDRVSTRGVILVHAGNDLLASVDRDSTAGRIAGQLLRWMLAEADALTRVEVPA
ncbi:MAG: phosphate starvation-inducible protein PhoH [Chloroflexi bacterium]|nr:phosphate starvation-inducible protein PhoH [Chloroflexota bacterium]